MLTMLDKKDRAIKSVRTWTGLIRNGGPLRGWGGSALC
jgi:hypothetical protein